MVFPHILAWLVTCSFLTGRRIRRHLELCIGWQVGWDDGWNESAEVKFREASIPIACMGRLYIYLSYLHENHTNQPFHVGKYTSSSHGWYGMIPCPEIPVGFGRCVWPGMAWNMVGYPVFWFATTFGLVHVIIFLGGTSTQSTQAYIYIHMYIMNFGTVPEPWCLLEEYCKYIHII